MLIVTEDSQTLPEYVRRTLEKLKVWGSTSFKSQA